MWLQQLGATLLKNLHQRRHSPIRTLFEVFLPLFFITLLSAAYWHATSVEVPVTDYSLLPIQDLSGLTFTMCYNESVPGVYIPCASQAKCGYPIHCLSQLNDMICIYECASFYGTSMGLRLGNPATPIKVPKLQELGMMQAAFAYQADVQELTMAKRNPLASIAHAGKLLLAGDTELCSGFAAFLTKNTGLIQAGLLLDPTSYADVGEAVDYAVRQAPGTVWAVVEFRSSTEVAIHLNQTATPSTRITSKPDTLGAGDSDYQLYVYSGFLTLQNYAMSFLRENDPNADAATLASIPNLPDTMSQLSVGLMPTPSYTQNSYLNLWAYYTPIVIVLALLYPVARLASLVVEEKQLRIRESMLIMGLPQSCLYASWWLSSFVISLLSSVCVAIVQRFGYLDGVSYGVILILFLSLSHMVNSVAFLVSAVVTNPRIGGSLSAFVVLLGCCIFYLVPSNMTSGQWVGLSFLPCVAYGKSCSDLLTRVTMRERVTASDYGDGEFTLSTSIGVMWGASAIYLVLALYLDNVLPTSVGQRRHPLFFLPSCVLRCIGAEQPGNEADGAMSFKPSRSLSDSSNTAVVAKETNNTPDAECAAVLRGVTKRYGGVLCCGGARPAVDGVDMRLQFGEVNVLLGPNGAGKTTLMGLMSGMVPISRGAVQVCGHETGSDLAGARRHIGYCPQSDIVWPELTVAEHLSFYARMKSSSSWDVRAAVEEVMSWLQLSEKADAVASELSGGQRRRLCVGIALIGGSKLILLDEPTAGMDVSGRRAVYDALSKQRGERSVLISTHLLEEADRVGDRIWLLNEGKMVGSGSPLFLKSELGVGYRITCVLERSRSVAEEDRRVEALTAAIRDAMHGMAGHPSPLAVPLAGSPALGTAASGCQLQGLKRRGCEVTFQFPLSALSEISAMSEKLEERQAELHVRSFGLSMMTLEEVFVALTKCDDCAESGVVLSGCPFVTGVVDGTIVGEEGNSKGVDWWRYQGCVPTCLRDTLTMFMKRLHCARRDIRLLLFMILLPLVFLILAFAFDSIPPHQDGELLVSASEPSYLTMSMLPNTQNAVTNWQSVVGSRFKLDPLVPCAAAGVCDQVLSGSLTSALSGEDVTLPMPAAIALSGFPPAAAAGGGGPRPHMAIPTSICPAYTKSPLCNRGPGGGGRRMAAPKPLTSILVNATQPHAAPLGLALVHDMLHRIALGSKGSEFEGVKVHNSPFPKTKSEKKFDDANRRVIVGMFVIIPFTLIPAYMVGYMVREKQSGARHLQWLTGVSPVAYWGASMLFDFVCFAVIEVLTMVIFMVADRKEFIGSAEVTGATILVFLLYGVSSIPFAYVVSYFFNSPVTAQNATLAFNLVFGFLWTLCEEILGSVSALQSFVVNASKVFRIFPAVSFGEGIFILSGSEIGSIMAGPKTFGHYDMFAWLQYDGAFYGGVRTSLVYMAASFGGYTLLLVVLELVRVLRGRGSSGASDRVDAEERAAKHAACLPCDGGKSVQREAEAVCREQGRLGDVLTLQKVTKRYGSLVAAHEVSFGVEAGQILALLGVNGAGKSTTVGVIAGDVTATSGRVFVDGKSLLGSLNRSAVGYCPQYDALLDDMSAQEHLRMFAALRGMSDEYISERVPAMLCALGLDEFAHRPSRSLSGGNKRRLSLAIALIGNTRCVVLDEPTAGMDIVARRQTCRMVLELSREKAVLLTTHLMDEVDALASRVATMSSGELQCIGSPQDIRSMFSEINAMTVQVIFAQDLNEESTAAASSNLLAFFEAELSSASGEPAVCPSASVIGRTVSLRVRGSTAAVCRAVGRLETREKDPATRELPLVEHLSAAQPSLDDILLLLTS